MTWFVSGHLFFFSLLYAPWAISVVFLPYKQRGWEGLCAARRLFLFYFPCSADPRRGWLHRIKQFVSSWNQYYAECEQQQ